MCVRACVDQHSRSTMCVTSSSDLTVPESKPAWLCSDRDTSLLLRMYVGTPAGLASFTYRREKIVRSNLYHHTLLVRTDGRYVCSVRPYYCTTSMTSGGRLLAGTSKGLRRKLPISTCADLFAFSHWLSLASSNLQSSTLIQHTDDPNQAGAPAFSLRADPAPASKEEAGSVIADWTASRSSVVGRS